MADVWINGELSAAAAASVAYDDHGITVGDGVFETVKLDGQVPFHLDRHLDRLRRSAEMMSLPCPADDELRRGIDAVLGTHHETEGFLRITLTGGPGPLGTPRGELSPTLIVAVRPGTVRIDPTDVITVAWTRNEHGALAGVKSTSYGENVRALVLAEAAGASEAIFATTGGNLCEGTGSNVFVGIGGRLVTPPLSSGCLAGVTRGLLLEIGVGVEADISMDDVRSADEMFLTSTGREVQPVRRLDGDELGTCPGPLTAEARRRWVEQILRT